VSILGIRKKILRGQIFSGAILQSPKGAKAGGLGKSHQSSKARGTGGEGFTIKPPALEDFKIFLKIMIFLATFKLKIQQQALG